MPLAFRPRSPELPYRDAVGLVLLNEPGLVLVGQIIDRPSLWKFPQGGLEGSETWEDAAKREAREETGVRELRLITATQQFHCYEYPQGSQYMPGFRGQRFKWFMARTHATELNPARFAPPEEGPEFSRLRWVKPEESLVLLHNNREGDAVTQQRQTMLADVMREFGLLPVAAPGPAQRPVNVPRHRRHKNLG